MSRSFLPHLVAGWALLSIGLEGIVVADEAAEPKLVYSVQIGDRTVNATEGETVQIPGDFRNPKLTITPQPFRVFACQGVSFQYPRTFTFEADLEDRNSKSWTLSGNDFKIMYFVMNAAVSTDEFADSLIGQFKPDQGKVVDAHATIRLGKHRLEGTSVQLTVAGHSMLTEIYRVSSRGDRTRMLLFQDGLDDSGKRSDEGQKTLETIKSSFSMDP